MCLGVPMKIESIDGKRGVGSYSGGEYDIRLDLIEQPKVGEYVMVHAGMALDRLDEDQARQTLEALREFDELSGRVS
ncbi:MAG TPA: HypC/HybG/HupF family hydrogenase formation chaperone [Planctomycetota bacterium]|nr:HypC/HybG/HupF family hydrogenase formation chaperone [Planctomycetota bacterium]